MKNMNKIDFTRRGFMFAAAGAALAPRAFSAGRTSFASADEAFAAVGFDPAATGHGFFTVIADPHVSPVEKVGMANLVVFKETVKEINLMRIKPVKMLVLGDLVTRGNPCFGNSISDSRPMIEDFESFKGVMAGMDPSVKWEIIPGNHDAMGPEDRAYPDFCRAFGMDRPWHRADAFGLPIIMLNGGHNGELSSEQEKWLCAQLVTLPPKGEVILAIHQPPGNTVAEWRSSAAMRSFMEAYDGETVILAGHNHGHNTVQLMAPCGKSAAQITVQAFRNGSKPTYWLVGIAGGQIAALVKRESEGAFTVHNRSAFPGHTWSLPFENVPGLIRTYECDKPGMTITRYFSAFTKKPNTLSKCGYYFSYPKGVEGFIETPADKSYAKLFVNCNLMFAPKKKRNGEAFKDAEFLVSADGFAYALLKFERAYGMAAAELPSELRKVGRLFFKVSFDYIDGMFSGLALGV